MNLECVEYPVEEDGSSGAKEAVTHGEANLKRARDDDKTDESDEVTKNQKMEKSVLETRLKNLEGGTEEGEQKKCSRVSLGLKSFESAVEMFDYFHKFLHSWPPNLNVHKNEHLVLLDLIRKGYPEPEKKIRGGISSFQVRYHPTWQTKCFFLVREDGSVDDFSLRKCVDHILPLPEHMKIKPDAKHRGGKTGGACGRRGRG